MNIADLYRLLRVEHLQAQGIVDTIADPMLVLDQNLRVQTASRAFFDTFKVERDDTIGNYVYDLGNGQWDIPDLRLLLSEVIPKSAAVIDYEVNADFPAIGQRTMLLTARTLFHPDNASRSLLLIIVDATERVRRDATKDLLFGEIRHRMKNLFAVAQSIAYHTATEGRTADEYRDDFLGRFRALTEAQDVIFSQQDATDLKTLVERILAPFAEQAAVVIEPSAAVRLASQEALSLGLALHELATNAAKYGALSAVGGQARIGWRIEPEDNRLRLTWRESGGPPVRSPGVTGYGTQLIQSTISYGLGGEVEREFAESGVQVAITAPLSQASVS